ncbi:hypothetical protein AG1IA_02203 [Rhizoctonia solani AG-1 IA]|uniref:Uncharacterized protein n=1 Tax=Thanatephorus cucumeris (strain AG1-IA) TaxID=983506 RepID=L8X0N7_THACA|nr:hypothetical protein AG1IA_02203 [Rhizoctonia solani AG-1 IA]
MGWEEILSEAFCEALLPMGTSRRVCNETKTGNLKMCLRRFASTYNAFDSELPVVFVMSMHHLERLVNLPIYGVPKREEIGESDVNLRMLLAQ